MDSATESEWFVMIRLYGHLGELCHLTDGSKRPWTFVESYTEVLIACMTHTRLRFELMNRYPAGDTPTAQSKGENK